MPSIVLIGFAHDLADRVATGFLEEGCKVSRTERAAELPPDAKGLVVSGDCPHWYRTVDEVRALRPDVRVVVATRLPDSRKWLDALDAGAHDYSCIPIDRQVIRWLAGGDSNSRFAVNPASS